MVKQVYEKPHSSLGSSMGKYLEVPRSLEIYTKGHLEQVVEEIFTIEHIHIHVVAPLVGGQLVGLVIQGWEAPAAPLGFSFQTLQGTHCSISGLNLHCFTPFHFFHFYLHLLLLSLDPLLFSPYLTVTFCSCSNLSFKRDIKCFSSSKCSFTNIKVKCENIKSSLRKRWYYGERYHTPF